MSSISCTRGFLSPTALGTTLPGCTLAAHAQYIVCGNNRIIVLLSHMINWHEGLNHLLTSDIILLVLSEAYNHNMISAVARLNVTHQSCYHQTRSCVIIITQHLVRQSLRNRMIVSIMFMATQQIKDNVIRKLICWTWIANNENVNI